MSAYRQFNMLCGPPSKFVRVQDISLIYHWQLMTCWIFKVLHSFCRILWLVCFKIQYWSTLSRKIILFEFFSEYFKFSTWILEKWVNAWMNSLICLLWLLTLDGSFYWTLDIPVYCDFINIPWTSIHGFYCWVDAQN